MLLGYIWADVLTQKNVPFALLILCAPAELSVPVLAPFYVYYPIWAKPTPFNVVDRGIIFMQLPSLRSLDAWQNVEEEQQSRNESDGSIN
jgi:hypothetical protein